MPASTREQLNRAARALLARAARRLQLDVVGSDFYSPIVHPERIPAGTFERPAPMRGIELDLEAQLAMLEGELRPFLEELEAEPAGLALENPYYGPMDAHVLYATLRRSPPRRVLELGSGHSTLIIARALHVNAERGAEAGAHEVVDPHPSPLLAAAARAPAVRRESATRTPEERFTSLAAGDVLFVDTSHVVKPGGEVVRVVLELLPQLAPGVAVHFHDIFRPFEYPRVLYERYNVHWQEQYLLEAFLAYNDNFAVSCANHALWRLRRERVMRLIPRLREGMQPSGFWLVRR